MTQTVYIGVGSNLGSREENIARAIDFLNAYPKIEVTRTSPLYETEAVIPEGGEDQPKFLNGAIEIRTTLSPETLLEALIDIEGALGRAHPRPKNAPRPIDLDILLYGDAVLDFPELKIPHPELEKRVFVLKPLCDIAARARHPVLDHTIEELLAANED